MDEAWDTARIREAFIYDGGEAEYHDPEHGAQTQRQVAGEIFDRWLAAHDAEVLREAATELEESIHNLDPEHPIELSFINCTRIDAKLLRERADRIARVPVTQEGAGPSGLLVAGLLHTSGDADSEREDADQPETDAEPVSERLIHPPRDDEHEQEQGADEQVPVELHTDDSTPDERHTSMKQDGADTDA